MGNVSAAVTKTMLEGRVAEGFVVEKSNYPMVQPDILDIAVCELGRRII